MNTLQKMLKQGLSRDHPIGVLLAQHEQLYTADLGGREAISNMEAGVVRRMASLDLLDALVDHRFVNPDTGRTRMLSHAKLQALCLLKARLTETYLRAATVLGVRRREKLVDPFRQEMERQEREAAQAEQVEADDDIEDPAG